MSNLKKKIRFRIVYYNDLYCIIDWKIMILFLDFIIEVLVFFMFLYIDDNY